jgi:hypothetical protein
MYYNIRLIFSLPEPRPLLCFQRMGPGNQKAGKFLDVPDFGGACANTEGLV